jgi:hypothetical protein
VNFLNVVGRLTSKVFPSSCIMTEISSHETSVRNSNSHYDTFKNFFPHNYSLGVMQTRNSCILSYFLGKCFGTIGKVHGPLPPQKWKFSAVVAPFPQAEYRGNQLLQSNVFGFNISSYLFKKSPPPPKDYSQRRVSPILQQQSLV